MCVVCVCACVCGVCVCVWCVRVCLSIDVCAPRPVHIRAQVLKSVHFEPLTIMSRDAFQHLVVDNNLERLVADKLPQTLK